jgi:hypothetical protein
MNIFEWYIKFDGFGVHVWSLLILIILCLYVLYTTRKHKIWSFTFSSIALGLSVHIYEFHHALSEYVVTRYDSIVSLSVNSFGLMYINLILFIVIFVVLLLINKKFQVLTKDFKIVLFCYVLYVMSMVWLTSSGFFVEYPVNIKFGVEWALSKVMCSVFVISLFRR